jgi:glycosyltransferase involved in cell wall biosynthesis
MIHSGIKIVRVWGTRFPKLSFFGKLFNQISYVMSVFFYLLLESSQRPILVLTNPPFLAIICVLIQVFRGRPFIYLVFDVYPDTAIKHGVLSEKGLIARAWDWMNRLILKKAGAIIVLGRCMRKIILKKGERIDSLDKKVHMISIWSDDRQIRRIDKAENPYIKKWNLEGKFVINYSGNMGRFHDMETIMEAAKELKDNPNIVFLFIGEGYKKKGMMEDARKWRLTNCQFHTYVERNALSYSLSCADLGLVSLASGQEGLSVPSKTFGLLAAGIPVIAIMPSASEIAMIIQENHCGFVIEPGDIKNLVEIIVRLSGNADLLENLKKNALQTIKSEYNIRNAAEKYFSIIDLQQY